MFDEGHNLVTVHLPESIDILKQQKKHDTHGQSDKRRDRVSAHMSTTPSVLDVEYEEDFAEEIEKKEETDMRKPAQEFVDVAIEEREKFNENETRRYSIETWNGSPLLPNFENFKNNAKYFSFIFASLKIYTSVILACSHAARLRAHSMPHCFRKTSQNLKSSKFTEELSVDFCRFITRTQVECLDSRRIGLNFPRMRSTIDRKIPTRVASAKINACAKAWEIFRLATLACRPQSLSLISLMVIHRY
jgi:hypothetical protein